MQNAMKKNIFAECAATDQLSTADQLQWLHHSTNISKKN